MSLKVNHTVLDRFLKYVKVDTQSDPNSKTFPSTEKQKNLAKILVEELLEIGLSDAHTDEFGYVYATIPSTTDKDVPVICFCSHMDTSPDSSGKDVKPIIHKNYDGSDLILPDDNNQVISPKRYPLLLDQIGNDIVTASGLTLLGADNKSGVAEIMDAATHLINHPEIKHGKIRILFTPDEEVGHGVDHVDIEKLGADFGYTMDGAERGSFEDETFSADGVEITINGVSIHPGFAKNKLESAVKAAGEVLARLPKDGLSPETTEKREGFIHPVQMSGIVEKASIQFIIRDFTDEKLAEHEAVLKNILDEVMKGYPNSTAEFKVTEQYRNMKKVLDNYPQISENALEAIRRAGLKPKQESIRGGTDGSRLSFMGLPCPNIFAGEHAFHSKHEWVSVQDMEKAVETIIHLCMIWEERA
ncbi:MAG: peptidase T [Bacteroidetes bacterium]|jgi:tripeptide aminopeptidase|nr:peptidase T [Bacteroidota bacterium]MDF1864185.1 peptidase T [Saprospiraceae bacterium]